MLINIAPIAIHARREEKPHISDIPTHRQTIAIAIESRFPLPVNHLIKIERIKPSTAPNKSPPIISITGLIITLSISTSPELPIILATATEIPNAIKATASSIATTGSKVSVTGPFALYCFTTIMVAAGAVAEAIAPRTSENFISHPAKIRARSTNKTAPKPSQNAIITGDLPIFLR